MKQIEMAQVTQVATRRAKLAKWFDTPLGGSEYGIRRTEAALFLGAIGVVAGAAGTIVTGALVTDNYRANQKNVASHNSQLHPDENSPCTTIKFGPTERGITVLKAFDHHSRLTDPYVRLQTVAGITPQESAAGKVIDYCLIEPSRDQLSYTHKFYDIYQPDVAAAQPHVSQAQFAELLNHNPDQQ